MTVRRRLSALEQRLPAALLPCPEPIHLPSLVDFPGLPPQQQEEALLSWEPTWEGDAALVSGADRSLEDYQRLVDAQERVGREALLPYVESLPLAERIDLLRRATQVLPPDQVWRLRVLRFACRPEWKRRMEEQIPGGAAEAGAAI